MQSHDEACGLQVLDPDRTPSVGTHTASKMAALHTGFGPSFVHAPGTVIEFAQLYNPFRVDFACSAALALMRNQISPRHKRYQGDMNQNRKQRSTRCLIFHAQDKGVIHASY